MYPKKNFINSNIRDRLTFPSGVCVRMCETIKTATDRVRLRDRNLTKILVFLGRLVY